MISTQEPRVFHIMTTHELERYGDDVGGGAEYGTENLATGTAVSAASFRMLAYMLGAAALASFATRFGSCFTRFTRNTCANCALSMRNRYNVGTAGYVFFNGLRNSILNLQNTLEETISEAAAMKFGPKPPDPPV